MAKCKKHPKYKGLRQPRVACEVCWIIYLGMSGFCVNCGCIENNKSEKSTGEAGR